jgi:chemotaxis signal transduction protein
VAEEVSAIVPASDASSAVAELAVEIEEAPADDAELAPARAWEPVVVDSSTDVDDIHAAILASVTVDLEPIAPAVADAAPAAEAEVAVVDPAPEAASVDAAHAQVETVAVEPLPTDTWAFDAAPIVPEFAERPLAEATEFSAPVASDGPADDAPAFESAFEALMAGMSAELEPAAETVVAPFALTPFVAGETALAADPVDDTEAPWPAEMNELGLDVAPQLDLDGDSEADLDDQPVAPTAVVLPWPSQEPKLVAAAAPHDVEAVAPHDLIEAALSGLHADLTAEPVEPLRTPDVAVSTAHVVFRLGSRTLAIPLAAVSEIARPPKVTRLPHVPAWVLGIANLRGDIVSMLDLEGFFSGKAGKSSHEQRMLALRPAGDEVRTAVLVDGVDGIQAFEDARIARVTRGYDAEVAPYARGLYQMEDELVVVLDADRLLQSKPMRQFEDGAGAR